MMVHRGVGAVAVGVVLGLASVARGETISYPANLHTSKGNPVYDILILEADATHQVHATPFAAPIPGLGLSAISHDVSFTPVKSLIIGLTDGTDADGNDKTQLVMFLDSAFAAAHAGQPFSSIFVGARHSTTIASLQAALAGDATQLSWFTDSFFSGPAAGAAFDSRGPFTVAEFTSLTITGAEAVAGEWMITSLEIIPFNDPDAINGRATAVLNETAKVDTGPFDIAFSLSTTSTLGQVAIDKTVVNNTGVPWQRFEMTLGTALGAAFTPSSTGDGAYFVTTLDNREETGAFPDVAVSEDRLVFTGLLPPGGTARFIVFVGSTIEDRPTVTVRQVAVGAVVSTPAMGQWPLAALVLALTVVGWLTSRRLAH